MAFKQIARYAEIKDKKHILFITQNFRCFTIRTPNKQNKLTQDKL